MTCLRRTKTDIIEKHQDARLGAVSARVPRKALRHLAVHHGEEVLSARCGGGCCWRRRCLPKAAMPRERLRYLRHSRQPSRLRAFLPPVPAKWIRLPLASSLSLFDEPFGTGAGQHRFGLFSRPSPAFCSGLYCLDGAYFTDAPGGTFIPLFGSCKVLKSM